MTQKYLIRWVSKLFTRSRSLSLKPSFDNQTKRKRRQVLIKRTESIVDQAKEGFFIEFAYFTAPVLSIKKMSLIER